jgi:transposase
MLTDPGTGEVRPGQIFVAAMGASNYTYAEATLTQRLPDWIDAHVRALAFMGGVPAQLVPDNPKGRGRSRQLVRTGPQPDVSRPRNALRHRDPTDAQQEAAGQG